MLFSFTGWTSVPGAMFLITAFVIPLCWALVAAGMYIRTLIPYSTSGFFEVPRLSNVDYAWVLWMRGLHLLCSEPFLKLRLILVCFVVNLNFSSSLIGCMVLKTPHLVALWLFLTGSRYEARKNRTAPSGALLDMHLLLRTDHRAGAEDTSYLIQLFRPVQRPAKLPSSLAPLWWEMTFRMSCAWSTWSGSLCRILVLFCRFSGLGRSVVSSVAEDRAMMTSTHIIIIIILLDHAWRVMVSFKASYLGRSEPAGTTRLLMEVDQITSVFETVLPYSAKSMFRTFSSDWSVVTPFTMANACTSVTSSWSSRGI